MSKQALFSSVSDHWNTPKMLYHRLNEEFDFTFDPCPSHSKSDGLLGKWGERNFINPPFSQVSKWIRKGYVESLKGKLCVFLVAARTDTQWFHKYVLPHAKEIRFIRGRLKFTKPNHPPKAKQTAPFPSCIIIFDGRVA